MRRVLSTTTLAWALLTAGSLGALAQQTPPASPPPDWYWGPGPWHMGGMGYGWHFWWMPPMMLLFMIVMLAVMFHFMRSHRAWSDGPHHGGAPWQMMDRMSGPPTDTAMRILNERFARGEIQRDEYEERKAVILSSNGPTQGPR